MKVEEHFGKVYRWILKEIKERPLVFQQVDPPELKAEEISKIAKIAEEAGLAAFAVGGSVGAQGELLDNTIKILKENSDLPVILFPGNIATLSRYADAIYYMYMMNSDDPYWISGAQIAASMPVKKMQLEVIPTAYVIVEPGRAAGWVGKARVIPRNIPYLAAVTALGAQYMGAHLAILESGGGAAEPAPAEMIKATKELIDIPLVVAGGVRKEEYAERCTKAGADILHVGTAIEKVKGDINKAKEIISKLVKAAERGRAQQ